MESKKWWQSKTVWAGVCGMIIAAYNSNPFGWPVVPEFVYGILGALGVYGRTTATTQVK